MKTAYNIIADWLKKHGYDGLCHPPTECGCLIDDDGLFPCCNAPANCVPGYKRMLSDGDWEVVVEKNNEVNK